MRLSHQIAVVASLVVSAAAVTVPAPAAADDRPSSIVSLGDSYIAGNGGRWLGNSTSLLSDRNGTDRAWSQSGYDAHRVYGTSYDNNCYRSDVSEIRSTPVVVDQKINLACSATKSVNLLSSASGGQSFRGEAPEDDQLSAIAHRTQVRMIAVSIGGNDLGFGEIIAKCFSAYITSPSFLPLHCRDSAQRQVEENTAMVKTRVGAVLDDIHRVMESAGYAPDSYRIVLQANPSPFPRGSEIRYPEAGSSRMSEGGCPMWNTDADWARDQLAPEFATLMHDTARAHRADFLDMHNALQGREACSLSTSLVGDGGPSATRSEWVRSAALIQGNVEETIHPNAYGQQAMGRCLGLAYTNGPGDYACTNTPGQDMSGMKVQKLPR
ncbi:hypothetical protein [Kitasatospora sp. GAS1066B]|uniref:hypothetical protein n=1 Tax=Kitasatospora sp. GAS1066B TaxID=3156271 RepID=UPI003515CA5A